MFKGFVKVEAIWFLTSNSSYERISTLGTTKRIKPCSHLYCLTCPKLLSNVIHSSTTHQPFYLSDTFTCKKPHLLHHLFVGQTSKSLLIYHHFSSKGYNFESTREFRPWTFLPKPAPMYLMRYIRLALNTVLISQYSVKWTTWASRIYTKSLASLVLQDGRFHLVIWCMFLMLCITPSPWHASLLQIP